MHYSISFAKAHIKNNVKDATPQQYSLKQLRLFYIRYVTFGRMKMKNSEVLALLEALNEDPVSGIKLRTSHLNTDYLPAARTGFILLFLEATKFYIY